MAKDCKDTALSYLEHRERSTWEVKEHLKTKGFSGEEISETLEFLRELHYVDDERYCSNYIRYGMSKGKGPVRIQFELKERGINSSLIQSGLEEAFDSETEREAAEKEAGRILSGEDEEKALAKAARRLSGLGYHTNVIFDVINRFRKN